MVPPPFGLGRYNTEQRDLWFNLPTLLGIYFVIVGDITQAIQWLAWQQEVLAFYLLECRRVCRAMCRMGLAL
jgi:hypothetical protein